MSPAPLISIPSAPVPAGAEAAWFDGAGKARLRAALFPARGAVRGSIVLSGGRTEPIEKYLEVIEDLGSQQGSGVGGARVRVTEHAAQIGIGGGRVDRRSACRQGEKNTVIG